MYSLPPFSMVQLAFQMQTHLPGSSQTKDSKIKAFCITFSTFCPLKNTAWKTRPASVVRGSHQRYVQQICYSPCQDCTSNYHGCGFYSFEIEVLFNCCFDIRKRLTGPSISERWLVSWVHNLHRYFYSVGACSAIDMYQFDLFIRPYDGSRASHSVCALTITIIQIDPTDQTSFGGGARNAVLYFILC